MAGLRSWLIGVHRVLAETASIAISGAIGRWGRPQGTLFVFYFGRQAPGIGGALRRTGKTNVKAPGNPGISRVVHDLEPVMNLDEAR